MLRFDLKLILYIIPVMQHLKDSDINSRLGLDVLCGYLLFLLDIN